MSMEVMPLEFVQPELMKLAISVANPVSVGRPELVRANLRRVVLL